MRVIGGAAVFAASSILIANVTAHAASLGPINSASLFVTSPIPVAQASVSDDFTTGSGPRQTINNRVLPTGQQWNAVNNTFAVQSGSASPWNNASTVRMATLPWMFLPTSRVSATLSASGSYNFGLVLHADVASSTGMVLRLSAGDVAEIAIVNSGVVTVLATGTGGPNASWALDYNNGVFTGIRNGTPVVSYDASALPGRPTFSTAGLYLQGGNNLTWDDFLVVTP